MINAILLGLRLVILVLSGQKQIALENAAMRQQLAVFKREVKRSELSRWDRSFWIGLKTIWKDWRSALVIVRPATVIGWQRTRFKRYWSRLSQRNGPGQPPVSSEIRKLVRTMVTANDLWGAPRIHGELLKLGFDVSERTVSRLILVLAHDRRRVLHFNVTEHPTAIWAAQQIVEAFPEDSAPRYPVRDRDGIYGRAFTARVEGMGIEEVRTSARSPWQNCYVERVIGSIRRECLNHMIVINSRHLRRILKAYLRYYHESRTHLSLEKDTPDSQRVHPRESGRIVQVPEVGGLHHRYERRAA